MGTRVSWVIALAIASLASAGVLGFVLNRYAKFRRRQPNAFQTAGREVRIVILCCVIGGVLAVSVCIVLVYFKGLPWYGGMLGGGIGAVTVERIGREYCSYKLIHYTPIDQVIFIPRMERGRRRLKFRVWRR